MSPVQRAMWMTWVNARRNWLLLVYIAIVVTVVLYLLVTDGTGSLA